jgi:hypothetical protein
VALVPSSSRGGGSAAPTTHGVYNSSASVTIADAGQSLLLIDQQASGDDVLDLTDPVGPIVRAAGSYAVAVEVSPDDEITAGGTFYVTLILAGGDVTLHASSAPAVTTRLTPYVLTSATYYFAADDFLGVRVRNNDGAATRGFTVNTLAIQRLS